MRKEREREIGERSPFRNCFRVQLTRKKYSTEKREREREIGERFSFRNWFRVQLRRKKYSTVGRDREREIEERFSSAKRDKDGKGDRENRNRQDRNLGVRDREGDEAEAAGGLFGRCHPIRIAQGMPKALFPY